MATVFDPCVFKPEYFRAFPIRNTVSGPVSASGLQQVVSSPGGLWTMTAGNFRLRTRAALLAFRAFVAEARGGATEFEARLLDKRQAPWPVVAGKRVYTPGGIVYALTANALLNDTTVQITRTSGSAPEPGQHFSLTGARWGKRCYRIVTVDGAGPYTLGIETGLREDFSAGAAVDFETPGFIARVANGSEIEPDVRLGKMANPSVTFIESFTA